MSIKNIFTALLMGTSAVSAQKDSTIHELKAVTVTATRSAQSILNTPRSVSLISNKDIKEQAYQNLADLLQKAEGIFVPGTFQVPGSLQTLFIRGADNRQNLIMIDGIKLSDASTPDNGLDFAEVSLNNVDRVEIVRGAQGTLYGNSAVGGVVNIITADSDNSIAIGKVFCSSDIVRHISFTGSTEVGRILMAQSAPSIKKLSLELGGNAPFIVFDDADIDSAVEGAMASKYRNAGQTCVCANRIYVQDGVYDAFVAKIKLFSTGFGAPLAPRIASLTRSFERVIILSRPFR